MWDYIKKYPIGLTFICGGGGTICLIEIEELGFICNPVVVFPSQNLILLHLNIGGTKMSDRISLEGLDKAAVLAALYNASRPQGLGFLHYDAIPMTTEQARAIIDQQGYDFDYLQGRVMKVDLSGNDFDPRLFDRDNGDGAAEQVIAALRQTGDTNPEEAELLHLEGTRKAAKIVEDNLGKKTTITKEGGVVTAELGIDEFADQLRPKVGKILDESGED